MLGQGWVMPGQLPGYARVWLRLWQYSNHLFSVIKFLTDSKTQRMDTYKVCPCFIIPFFMVPPVHRVQSLTLVVASSINLFIYCLNVATLYCHTGRSGTGAL